MSRGQPPGRLRNIRPTRSPQKASANLQRLRKRKRSDQETNACGRTRSDRGITPEARHWRPNRDLRVLGNWQNLSLPQLTETENDKPTTFRKSHQPLLQKNIYAAGSFLFLYLAVLWQEFTISRHQRSPRSLAYNSAIRTRPLLRTPSRPLLKILHRPHLSLVQKRDNPA